VLAGAAPQSAGKMPRVARPLALAHKFQGMLDRGEVESMAELARLGRVSRARITQIMDLLMLAPEIQEEVLFDQAPPELGLRDLLVLAHTTAWHAQRTCWCRPFDPRGGPVGRPTGIATLAGEQRSAA
jgi:hypothetical protein